jgi:hypothetical protein
MPGAFRDVDPRELRLPPSTRGGTDLFKLQLQIARFGSPLVGMLRPGSMRLPTA